MGCAEPPSQSCEVSALNTLTAAACPPKVPTPTETAAQALKTKLNNCAKTKFKECFGYDYNGSFSEPPNFTGKGVGRIVGVTDFALVPKTLLDAQITAFVNEILKRENLPDWVATPAYSDLFNFINNDVAASSATGWKEQVYNKSYTNEYTNSTITANAILLFENKTVTTTTANTITQKMVIFYLGVYFTATTWGR